MPVVHRKYPSENITVIPVNNILSESSNTPGFRRITQYGYTEKSDLKVDRGFLIEGAVLSLKVSVIQILDNPHPEGLMYLLDTTTYSPAIPTSTCRFLGPSNSQKYRACQVPSDRRPSITGTVRLNPISDALIWASEFPSACR